jgi:hypothetical protein
MVCLAAQDSYFSLLLRMFIQCVNQQSIVVGKELTNNKQFVFADVGHPKETHLNSTMICA